MKKIIFLLSLVFFALHGSAQPANGSNAPDFTVTDINGNQHRLSNYLKAGKTVILEFSGVGCGVSWKYLRTEALQDFYNAYGSPGSNEVVVLFIEDGTVLSELKGADSLGFGNWVEGTPFPIVLNRSIHGLYAIDYLPKIYRICPNGIMNTIGQPSSTSYSKLVNRYCGVLSGVKNFVKVLSNTNGFCDRTGSFKASLKNYGTNNVIEATLKLKENGVVIGTKKFTVDIPQFSTGAVEFDPVNINPSATYTTELVNVNGVQNHNPVYSAATLPFNIANHTGKNLQIKIHTYVCANNMSWEITNSARAIVAKGGPYGTPGPMCDWTNANSVVEHKVVLPGTKDCYSIRLLDATGFGWENYGYDALRPTDPGVEIFSDGMLVYSKLNVGNFGSVMKIENFLTTKDTLSSTVALTKKLNIFPNPSDGIIHVDSDSKIAVRIFNLIGQIVFSSDNIDMLSAIDLSKFNSGIYIVKIVGKDNKETVRKLILNN